jgi:inositol-phosphate transport system permease protein
MTSETVTSPVSELTSVSAPGFLRDLYRSVRNGVLVGLVLVAAVVVIGSVLRPLIASAQVSETMTSALANLLTLVLPFASYMAVAATNRGTGHANTGRALLITVIGVLIVYAVITPVQYAMTIGPFAARPSIQAAFEQGEEGVIVRSVTPGGASETAGVQVGDVITAIRRDPVTLDSLLATVSQASLDDPLRLRILRNGEETQLTVRVTTAADFEPGALFMAGIIALVVGIAALFWPGGITAYILLILLLSPLLAGYAWLVIATFSYRTEGLLPIDGQGNIGGFTLENWNFLTRTVGSNPSIWIITLNTLAVAVIMTVLILVISAMAGYALSRMSFVGRKLFLSFTLILHGFPAVTLLISIFFVLNMIGKIPILGSLFGYNTTGGIALVMVGFELPLGIWLMKGFFDNIPWDMERSAMIDGASRWRTFREILLPQIRPGILALGIFAFISGWNAYLIPRTYSLGTKNVTLAVFLSQLTGDTAPVSWNQVAAVGVFQLIPIIIFFVFAQEYLLNIYAGGTKGSS